MLRSVAIVTAALLIGACSSNDEKNIKPVKLVDFDKTVDVKYDWSQGVGEGAGEYYQIFTLGLSADNIVAVDHEGRLEKFDLDSGKTIWRNKLGAPVTGGVGVSGGNIYLGSEAGEVIALDDEGEEQWKTVLSSEVLSAPQRGGNVVIAQTLDGQVFGLNAETGEEIWAYNISMPALTLRGTGSPVIAGSSAIVGFSSGKLVALDINDGVKLWEQRVALAQGRSELDRVIDIDGSPLLVGEILYAVSYQGRLVALNRSNGRILWAQEESSINNMSASHGKVYVSNAEGVVKAYNATSGDLVWTNDQMLRRKLNAPQAVGDYVSVADFEGYLHVLNHEDGSLMGRRKIDGDGVRSPMVATDDTLYIYGNSGKLAAVSIEQK